MEKEKLLADTFHFYIGNGKKGEGDLGEQGESYIPLQAIISGITNCILL